MVHQKMSKKLGNQPQNTLKTEKTHDADLKKSQLIKYSDVEFPPQTEKFSPKNYMKSTDSSEARIHKVGKSSSFKHKHTKKMVVCKNVETERAATCSSTLKDSKFPSFLELTPGATEAEGTSVMKVCSYKYCSLNGHHRIPEMPPLKAFLSSRRKKMLKTLKNSKSAEDESDKDDVYVEINLSEMSFGSEEKTDEKCLSITPIECCYSIGIEPEIDSDSTMSQDRVFRENSDLEWEEGQIIGFDDEKVEVSVGKEYGDDESGPGFELPWNIHDLVVMELLQFSDANTLSDGDFSLTEEEDSTEEKVKEDETNPTAKLGEDFTDEEDTNPVAEVSKTKDEDLDSFKKLNETGGDEINDDLYMREQRILTYNSTEEQISTADDEGQTNETGNNKDARLSVSTDCQEPIGTYFIIVGSSSTNSDQEHVLNKVKLQSFEKYVEEVKGVKTEKINQAEEEVSLPDIRQNSQQVQTSIPGNKNDATDELLEICNKLKRSVQCRKVKEESEEEDREFNPRAPNFLPIEPKSESEKVDLRHQDMDERRNAEDWMLDHALQKSVNQLSSARKKKVALLVEAFEFVLPVTKYESHARRNSSCFYKARPIQACR